MPRWETSGEIVHRRHNSLEWKLEEGHFLGQQTVASPPFRYADSLWYLAKWASDSEWVGLGLCATSSQGPALRVHLGLRRADGRNLRHRWGTTGPRGSFEVARYARAWRGEIEEVAHHGYVTVFCEVTVAPPSFRLRLPGQVSNDDGEASRRDPNAQQNLQLSAEDETIEKEKSEEKTERLKSESVDKLLEDLKALRVNAEEHDITFVVQGEEISAHKLVLGARCPVFRSMFKHEMLEQASGVVEIDDCNPDSFRDLLLYIYAGSVEAMSPANVYGLFAAADKYCLDELRRECLEIVKRELCVDTFCDTVELALRYAEDGLLELATKFYAKHIKEIIVLDRWETFLRENTKEGNRLLVKALLSEE